jgi:hypothetical protein
VTLVTLYKYQSSSKKFIRIGILIRWGDPSLFQTPVMDGSLKSLASDGERVYYPAYTVPLKDTFNSLRGRPAVIGDYVYFQGNDNQPYALDRYSSEIRWAIEPQARS